MLMRSQTPTNGVGKFAAMLGSIQSRQHAKHEEDHDSRDGVETESLSKRRCSESNREQHEENSHNRPNDVHGIGQGSPAGCQYRTLVHRRPREAENAVSDQQTSHDAQGSVPPSRLPDTISKGGEKERVDSAKQDP